MDRRRRQSANTNESEARAAGAQAPVAEGSLAPKPDPETAAPAEHLTEPVLTGPLSAVDRFAAEYASTWSHPFRHHTDIVADQLHHYYAQFVGKAVPGRIRYEYIGLDDDRYLGTLRRMAKDRRAQTFCLNDAPLTGLRPIADDYVRQWLERYFPIPSEFESG